MMKNLVFKLFQVLRLIYHQLLVSIHVLQEIMSTNVMELAGIDLLNGQVHGIVTDRHRSREFVQYLKILDETYSKDITIRIILDNHSAHISKETRGYLATVPNRFDFVFTPTHGSWLNIIESLFAKMAKTFLRGIRVNSKDELKQRILKWIEELNESPVVFRWKWRLNTISQKNPLLC